MRSVAAIIVTVCLLMLYCDHTVNGTDKFKQYCSYRSGYRNRCWFCASAADTGRSCDHHHLPVQVSNSHNMISYFFRKITDLNLWTKKLRADQPLKFQFFENLQLVAAAAILRQSEMLGLYLSDGLTARHEICRDDAEKGIRKPLAVKFELKMSVGWHAKTR